MKTCAKLSLFLALSLGVLHAQEEVPRGLLNIVNMIPGDARTDVRLGGEPIDPRGMSAGSSSGWFSLEAGQKTLVATASDGSSVSQAIEFGNGVATIYAIYLKPGKTLKSDGSHSSPTLKISAFPTFPARSGLLKITSLCNAERAFKIAENPVVLAPMKTIDSPKWSGKGFAVTYGGKVIGMISDGIGNSNYYVFIAPGNDGTFFAANANADHLGYRKGIVAKPTKDKL